MRSLCEFFYNNLKAGNEVVGFQDVFFCPLYVGDLAHVLLKLVDEGAGGLFHSFSRQPISKYDFGCLIADRFGFDKKLIRPISWRDGGLAAARSPNLRMDSTRLQKTLGELLPDQAQGIDRFFHSWQAGWREKTLSFAPAD